MKLPPIDTPLYNHPLPAIEQWLESQGCERDPEDPHCWSVQGRPWQARLCLDIEEIMVQYIKAGDDHQDIHRSFRYSLSRQDVEDAIFSGP